MTQSTFGGVGDHGDARAIWNANATDAEGRLVVLEGAPAQVNAALQVTRVNDANLIVPSLSPGASACYIMLNPLARTVTLPATSHAGVTVQVQNGASTGTVITVTVAGGGPIDFGTTATMSLQADFLEFLWDGAQWWTR